MSRVLCVISVLSVGASAIAQDDNCIENAAGMIVCGADADAVRARIRAESAMYENKTENVSTEVAMPTESIVNASAMQAVSAESESGQTYERKKKRSGSVYKDYGQAVFLRGGYAFASHNFGDGEVSVNGLMLAGGYRKALSKKKRGQISVEGEIVWLSDSEEVDLLGTPLETTVTGYTGIVALRWDANPQANLSPFASVGVGPAYYRVKAETPTTSDSDGDFAVGYTARAGVTARVGDRVTMEAAYRYLGATESSTIGFHGAEVGVNLGF